MVLVDATKIGLFGIKVNAAVDFSNRETITNISLDEEWVARTNNNA